MPTINTGKCPKCENVVYNVVLEQVDSSAAGGVVLRGLSYLCPHCRTILSIQIDPIAVKTEIVAALKGRG